MNIDIRAEERVIGRKSDLNNIRTNGFIPGIIYGAGKESVPIQIERNVFLKIYRKTIGELVFFNLIVADKEYVTIIKEKQIQPVTREIIHMDFQEISSDKKITVNVPIRISGTPIGVKNGGNMDVVLREIQISCLPGDILEDIAVDVSNLDIGDSIHVRDLNLGDIDMHIGDNVTIVIVHAPKSAEEEESAAGESEEAETAGEGDEETK